MIENEIRGGICQSITCYGKANLPNFDSINYDERSYIYIYSI